ncbi:MAG: outer membrane lipoprotein-sorting protein [Deltaproteobacteria bacterium]|nr:outer membrane lipoprotein-sorting protein [Deltaproteobacteria bacterium]
MRQLHIFSLLISTGALALGGAAIAADEPDAGSLLKDADRARGGLERGVTWTVEVESIEDGETTKRAFLVKGRGNDALAEAISPPRHKGEVMLFNDRTLWFVKPGLRKPVSISARQKLSGMAANGDIASTNYARDYEGKIVGVETLDGEETYRLELTAKAKNVTYDRIRYWVSKQRRLALKAEFLTLEGQVFKTAKFVYGNKSMLDGKEIDLVKDMTIVDTASNNQTVIHYSEAKAEDHAPSLFNVNNVAR